MIPGIVRYGQLIQSTDDVDIIRFRERVLRIQETPTGQGLDGTGGVLISEFERRGEFLVRTGLRIRDWEYEDLDTGLASSDEVDELVVLRELQ